ncbi:MAG: glycosyltransferase [Balneola sp.]
MKIAFLSDQIYPRTSADAEQIFSSLSALGTISEVTLVSFRYNYSKKIDKSDLEKYFEKKCTFNLRFVTSLLPNIRSIEKVCFALKAAFKYRNENFDVFYTRNIPVLISLLLFSKKKVVFESFRPWPDRNLQSRLFFKWISNKEQLLGIVIHSNFAKKSYLKAGFNNKKLLVAHNAFDIGEYDPQEESEVRNQLNFSKDKLLITYTGRISAKKGLNQFLRLAEENSEIQFLLVGSEKRGSIEKRAEKLQNVRVLGWQKKQYVFSLLTASDILYIPPTLVARDKVGNTVLPLKTFIYKASGTAIFGPDSEDVNEVLTHRKTAYLVEPDDWSKEVDGINELASNNELRERIGANARKEMLDNTWENRAFDILSFINNSIPT